jgi:hypothetical protein
MIKKTLALMTLFFGVNAAEINYNCTLTNFPGQTVASQNLVLLADLEHTIGDLIHQIAESRNNAGFPINENDIRIIARGVRLDNAAVLGGTNIPEDGRFTAMYTAMEPVVAE